MSQAHLLDLPFKLFFTSTAVGMVLTDLQGKILIANPAFARLVGHRLLEIYGRNFLSYIASGKTGNLRDLFILLLEQAHQGYETETRLSHKDGQTVRAQLGASLVLDATGKPLCALMTLATLSAGQHAGEEKPANEGPLRTYTDEQYRQILNGVPCPLIIINEGGRIEGINQHGETWSGYAERELIDRPVESLFPEASWQQLIRSEPVALGHEHAPRNALVAIHVLHKNGGRLPVLLDLKPINIDDRPLWVGIIQHLSERRAAGELPAHLAWHDALTGLYNHMLFQERLNHAIRRAEREVKKLGVLILDLDRFKRLNDSFGYQAGNQLLKDVGARIVTHVRKSDTVARLGGNHYALLLENLDGTEHIPTVVQKVFNALAPPFTWQGEDIYLTTSIGISVFPVDGTDGDTLMKNADSALHKAKKDGGNAFQFYTRELNSRAMERLKMDGELHRALNNGEFVLHYQPLVDSTGRRASSVEALLRWNHPENGLMPPLSFIPLLEESGLIVAVGDWILRAACERIKALRANGHAHLRMAVNISARQFAQKDFASSLEKILQETGVDPQALELEITESVLIRNTEESWKMLRAIVALGVSIALDDFGTGYSSLSYLKRFPIHTLKIDRNFVQGVPGKRDDVAITNAILALAESLGLRVVAEGVETEEQRTYLHERRCHELQGFLFAKPMPADQLDQWLVMNRGGQTPRLPAGKGK
jgi:diguanylate cyclase (GGDEF)-like protein/PAS domain S-box-containing protein